MKRLGWMKRLVLALALVATSVVAVSAADPKAKPVDDLFPDPVIAKGKGFEVKQSQIQDRFIVFRATAAARRQVVSEEDRPKAAQGILEQLIMVAIAKLQATSEDQKKAKELSAKIMDDSKKQAGSPEAFLRQLRALNMTEQEYSDRMYERALLEEFTVRQLKPSVTVPDTAIKSFYETNTARFEQPELVKLSHILLATVDPRTRQELPATEKAAKLDQAKKVLARVKGGEDFAKLAKEFSEDPGTKELGGEMTLARGMVQQATFEDTAFSLPPGKISDIVITQVGYHIIKVIERIPAKKVPLDEVSAKIREALELTEMEKLRPALFEKLKKEADVQILATPSL